MLTDGQDYNQVSIDEELLHDLEQLVRLAIAEDLERSFDLTTAAVVPAELPSSAHIVARKAGRAAGIALIEPICRTIGCPITVDTCVSDGNAIKAGQRLATISGNARDLLTCERTILNFVCRLCGIATLTTQFVDLVQGTAACLYDTRKTTPGWRRLEKYAVRCGGGKNHRFGLFEAILIKDNHLACHHAKTGKSLSPAEAVKLGREFLQSAPEHANRILEIEVDTLEQLESALKSAPDIVLLDNMSNEQLRQAVEMRNSAQPGVRLEASGGVRLETIAGIAATGVDRISVGALTHSAINLDLGLDWEIGLAGQSPASR
ncbi:MAG TPA: carboxylating nicotinate-nucleotide diphosphorylase [Planctomycetaceae bacterium]|nr:carboxylating nicotinate-nucleotide diphosphorylase [Planctomycetaceae bacterium]